MKRRSFLGFLAALIPGAACASTLPRGRRKVLPPQRPTPINSGRTRDDVDVYLNGRLLVPGVSYGDYGWEGPRTLSFNHKLKPDDVIAVVQYGNPPAKFTQVTEVGAAMDSIDVDMP